MKPGLNSSTVGPFPPHCIPYGLEATELQASPSPRPSWPLAPSTPQGPASGTTLKLFGSKFPTPLPHAKKEKKKSVPMNTNSIFLNWEQLPSLAHPSDSPRPAPSCESQQTLVKAGATTGGWQGLADRARLLSIRKQTLAGSLAYFGKVV